MLDHGVSEYQVIAITKAILRILNFQKLYLTQQVASISIEHMGSAPLKAAISLYTKRPRPRILRAKSPFDTQQR